jgi:hypothetical protein
MTFRFDQGFFSLIIIITTVPVDDEHDDVQYWREQNIKLKYDS